jgi:anti-anti-sigma regulatory factor
MVDLSEEDVERPASVVLGDRLCALLADGTTTVVVDLSGLRALSSDVVAALLSVRREAGARGSHVVLRASTSHSMSLLRRSRLVSLFEITTGNGPAWRHG